MASNGNVNGYVNNANTQASAKTAVTSSPPRSRPNVNTNVNVPPGAYPSPRRTGSEISLHSSITAKGERLPPLPPSVPQTPTSPVYDSQATIRHAEPPAPSRVPPDLGDDDEEEDYGELLEPQPYPHMEPQHDKHMQDLPDTAMLDSVVLPAIASVRYKHLLFYERLSKNLLQLFPRVSTQEARIALSTLQRAFTEAERIIPGVTNELVNEIVDSVEHVEDVP